MPSPLVILNSSPHGNVADIRSNQLLIETAAWFQVDAEAVNADQLVVAVLGPVLPSWPTDAVAVPRADLRSAHDLAQFATMLRGLAAAGVRTLVTADALLCAEDKYATHLALAAAGIPSVKTLALRASSNPGPEMLAAIDAVGGFPVVLKHPIGWGGMGVTLCRDLQTLRSVLTLVDQLSRGELMMLQPYLPHHASLTLLAISGKLVSAFRCHTSTEEFRTNPRFGGRTEKIPLDPELEDLAQRSLAACGLTYGSIDCLETGEGPKVVEVNSAPGLWPLERGDRRFAEALIHHAVSPSTPLARPRILIVIPFALHDSRGNSIAARRLLNRMDSEGVPAEVVAFTSPSDEASVLAAVRRFDPRLVHVLQAWRCGPIAIRIAEQTGKPIVLSFRGTDADEALDDPSRAALIAAALQKATVVTTLTQHQLTRLRARFPQTSMRSFVVPHGTCPVPSDRDWRRELGLTPETPLLVHLSGIRRVKGFGETYQIVDAIHARTPSMRYVLAGQILESDLEPALRDFLANRPFAHFLDAINHGDALALLATATVSLHTSQREGLSNALLESLALGIPAIARDIPASRAVLEDGVHGFLFESAAQAAEAFDRLVSDPELRTSISVTARRHASDQFSEDAEFEGYLAVYRAALSGRS